METSDQCADDIDDQVCNPIILNVRGNATEFADSNINAEPESETVLTSGIGVERSLDSTNQITASLPSKTNTISMISCHGTASLSTAVSTISNTEANSPTMNTIISLSSSNTVEISSAANSVVTTSSNIGTGSSASNNIALSSNSFSSNLMPVSSTSDISLSQNSSKDTIAPNTSSSFSSSNTSMSGVYVAGASNIECTTASVLVNSISNLTAKSDDASSSAPLDCITSSATTVTSTLMTKGINAGLMNSIDTNFPTSIVIRGLESSNPNEISGILDKTNVNCYVAIDHQVSDSLQSSGNASSTVSSKSTDLTDSLISHAVSYMNTITTSSKEGDKVTSNVPSSMLSNSKNESGDQSVTRKGNDINQAILESAVNENLPSSASTFKDTSVSSYSLSESLTPNTSSVNMSLAHSVTKTQVIASDAEKQNVQGNTIKVVVKGSQSYSKVISLPGIKTNVSEKIKVNPKNSEKKQQSDTEIAIAAANRVYNDAHLSYLLQKSLTMPEIFATTMLDPSCKSKENWETEYACLVCGDEFYTRVFLNHHLTRKVFELDYNCYFCKKTIRFFNKCNFWLHQTHVHSFEMDKNKLAVSGSSFSWKPYLGPSDQDIDLSFLNQFFCVFCSATFETLYDRKLHYQKCPLFKVTYCKYCQLPFSNSCALKAHLSIHDAGKKSVACPECGETFSPSRNLSALFEHLDSCYHFNVAQKMMCECEQVVSSRQKFKRHLIKCHTKMMLRCHVCDCTCTSFNLMRLHYKQHTVPESPSSIVLCTLCKKSLLTVNKLRLHIDYHVEMQISRCTSKTYMCFLCSEIFIFPSLLKKHVETHHTHKPKRCTICFGLFGSRQKLVEHIMSKTCSSKDLPSKFHVCLDMPKSEEVVDWNIYNELFQVYSTMSSANSPMASFSSVNNKEKNVEAASNTPCKTPNTNYNTSRSRGAAPYSIQKETNIKSTSNVNQKNSQGSQASPFHRTLIKIAPKPSDGKKFQCHSCKIIITGSNFYTDHLKAHENISGVNRPLRYCGICKKLVEDKLFQSHMEGHQSRGIIVCSLCHNRQFRTMKEALQHSRNLCFYQEISGDGVSFIEGDTTQTLSNSESSHDDTVIVEMQPAVASSREEPSLFPCLLCGYAFSTKEDKDDHVSRIHDGTRTLYYCMICRKRGSQKGFSKKTRVTKHISHKHRIVNPLEISKLIHEEEQNVMSGQVVLASENNENNNEGASTPKRLRLATEGEYVCGKCGYSNVNFSIFQEHILLHNAKKEPQCQECGLCFTVLAALKKHLFVVHKIKGIGQYLTNQGVAESESEEEELQENWNMSDTGFIMVDESSNDAQLKLPGSNHGTKSLECNVCYRTFSSQLVLQKHLRNHGMAFIHSKRHDKQ